MSSAAVAGAPLRLALATIGAVATGIIVYLLAVRLALPALALHLTDAQVVWLRDAFQVHPRLVATAILVAACALALPVPLVFRLMYGPLSGPFAERPYR